MKIISLQSGSNGNSIYVESEGTRILIDAGLSGRDTAQRLARAGVNICDIHGVLITHDHSDHVSGAGVLHRKYGLPLWMSEVTLKKVTACRRLGKLGEVRIFRPGEPFFCGNIRVETIRTSHDAAEGVCFTMDDSHVRFGVFTDLGCPFPGLSEALSTLDGVLLESNYDPFMLAHGKYPISIQARIRGRGGHLSNQESAQLLREASNKLRLTLLGHISHENNSLDLVECTYRETLNVRQSPLLATRYGATECFTL